MQLDARATGPGAGSAWLRSTRPAEAWPGLRPGPKALAASGVPAAGPGPALASASASAHGADTASGPGELRHVWHSRFGPIVIEVAGGELFVDGRFVERAPP